MKPYPQQIAAVKAAVKARRGVICMPTGFGKSITMALLVNELQFKTLIVVPNLGLKQQLSDTFLKLFGSLKNITIENIDSPNLENQGDYDCLIVDEAHHVAASTYRKLNKKVWNNIYYRYFFTATPFRSKDEEQLLYESIAGDVVYRVTYQEAVRCGAIVPIEAYYIEIPKSKVEGYTWQQVYSELVVNHTSRNKLIAHLINSLKDIGAPTLCLVKEIKHGELILEVSNSATEFANGESGNAKKLISQFNAGRVISLIGTLGVLGEGVDTKPAEFVIIAALGKSKNQFMQACGRAFRKSPGKESAKVILIKDRSHKFTLRHFNAQVKILKEEYGVEIVKIVPASS